LLLPADVDHDALLCAMYERAFVSDQDPTSDLALRARPLPQVAKAISTS
jgi:hypothetical protein